MPTVFLLIEGLELDFFNPRSLVVFICILQGAIFAALLSVRYFKLKNLFDLRLAALICASPITPLIGFADVYDRNQWLTYFPFGIALDSGFISKATFNRAFKKFTGVSPREFAESVK